MYYGCPISDEHTLEFLLAFNGRVHHLEKGYWLKFEIARVESSPKRPHGLRYSFTLHDSDGSRLLGFDNAHNVRALGSRFRQASDEQDHWHRTADDPGRPYAFTTADQLLADFFKEVARILAEHGVNDAVVSESGGQREEGA
jgi:hypothetical protein